jgi:hypothetical protein
MGWATFWATFSQIHLVTLHNIILQNIRGQVCINEEQNFFLNRPSRELSSKDKPKKKKFETRNNRRKLSQENPPELLKLQMTTWPRSPHYVNITCLEAE